MIIWLASYPRSGNTFFRTIIYHAFGLANYSIHNDDQSTIGADDAFSNIVGHRSLPTSTSLEELRIDAKLWPIKTHHPYPTFSKYYRPADKIIYIVRDGRESTLSYHHYLRNFTKSRHNLSDIIHGREMFGSWASNVNSWLDANPPHLFIKYEDLVHDPHQQTEKIRSYIDVGKKNYRIPSFQELKAINSRFFRSGQTCSWKQAFTEEELELFWALSGKTMIACGYTSDIPAGIDIQRLAIFSNGVPPHKHGAVENSPGGRSPTIGLRNFTTSYLAYVRSLHMELSRILNTNPFLRMILKRIPKKWLS